MDVNYWNENQPIEADPEQKIRCLKYEITMFRRTYNRLDSLSRPQTGTFELNLLVESLAIHTRVLIEFFYSDKESKYPNDLVAQDFLPADKSWRDVCPLTSKTDILIGTEKKTDRTLAHLSLWRIKLIRDGLKNWQEYREIRDDLEKVIEKFEEASNLKFEK